MVRIKHKAGWAPKPTCFVIIQHTKYTFVALNTVPKAEERLEVNEKHCEVGKAQRPNTWKDDYDDGDDDVLQYSTYMKLPLKFNGQHFFDIFTLLFPQLSESFAYLAPFLRHSDLWHTHKTQIDLSHSTSNGTVSNK